MGVVQKLFLACENRLPMKYIIPENIFDMTDICSSAYIDLQVHFGTYFRGGMFSFGTHLCYIYLGTTDARVFSPISCQPRHSSPCFDPTLLLTNFYNGFSAAIASKIPPQQRALILNSAILEGTPY